VTRVSFASVAASNATRMKKTLHNLVTLFSLLALILPMAALCLQPHQAVQRACDHCPPRNAPPACCSAHHEEPSTIVPSVKIQQPSQSPIAFLSVSLDNIVLQRPYPVTALKAPPPTPPLLALRIGFPLFLATSASRSVSVRCKRSRSRQDKGSPCAPHSPLRCWSQF
jgi:hypothetical protein